MRDFGDIRMFKWAGRPEFDVGDGMVVEDGVLIAFPPGIPGVNYDPNTGLPTQSYQDLMEEENIKHLADTAYIEKRKKEYLPMGDQLDMIYWDNKNQTDNWIKHIEKVKGNNPKPE